MSSRINRTERKNTIINRDDFNISMKCDVSKIVKEIMSERMRIFEACTFTIKNKNNESYVINNYVSILADIFTVSLSYADYISNNFQRMGKEKLVKDNKKAYLSWDRDRDECWIFLSSSLDYKMKRISFVIYNNNYIKGVSESKKVKEICFNVTKLREKMLFIINEMVIFANNVLKDLLESKLISEQQYFKYIFMIKEQILVACENDYSDEAHRSGTINEKITINNEEVYLGVIKSIYKQQEIYKNAWLKRGIVYINRRVDIEKALEWNLLKDFHNSQIKSEDELEGMTPIRLKLNNGNTMYKQPRGKL